MYLYVIHLYQENEGIKPVRWINQVLQHSWDLALEKKKKREKTTKSTLVQVTYIIIIMPYILQFRSYGDRTDLLRQ